MEAITDLIGQLLQQYGITGAAFGALLYLLWKNKKDADIRITELEKQSETQQVEQMANYKEMIAEYVELIKGKIEVLSKLTTCLETMNATLLRLENKNKD